jgi:hypothetical protein
MSGRYSKFARLERTGQRVCRLVETDEALRVNRDRRPLIADRIEKLARLPGLSELPFFIFSCKPEARPIAVEERRALGDIE